MAIEFVERITPTNSSQPMPEPDAFAEEPRLRAAVTPHAFAVGLTLAALAPLNAWLETVADIHFLGGIQVLLGAIFALLTRVLALNRPLPIRALQRAAPVFARIFPPLSSAGLIIVDFGHWWQRHRAKSPAFMLGLILRNAAAMMPWIIAGFFLGSQISYWPA